jgi:hypothetical protein
MKTSYSTQSLPAFSSIECLESRIAPAGLVTVNFSHGVLTIDGADGLDHTIEIVKTSLGKFSVMGTDTGINDVAVLTKNYSGTLNRIVFNGGLGADTVKLTNLAALKSLTFEGGAGVDTLTAANFKTTTAATVNLNLGAEPGTINFTGTKTTIHGPLNMNLGGGGTANFQATTSTTVDGAVTITGGATSDSVNIGGGATLFKNKLSFNGGDGNDYFTSNGTSMKVLGFVTMNGEAGANHFIFGAGTNTFGTALKAGLVDINLGVGAGSVSFLGNNTTILGNVTIDLGTGGGTALLNSALATTVRNSVDVYGGVGNDSLTFGGRTSIGGGLSLFGDAGDDSLSATGTLFSVKGDVRMDGSDGAGSLSLNVTTLSLASLTMRGGSANDTVSVIADGTITGAVSLEMGLDGIGPSSAILQSKAGLTNGLKIGGSLTVDMFGATVDSLTIANVQVAKTFSAQTGENVSTVNISKLNTVGSFYLKTGSGADVVNIDNVNAVNLYVDTESGADELRIERNAAYTGGSTVLGIARILTGIGADQVRIGDASDPANLKVSFSGAMTLDTGDGANMRNDVIASNTFVIQPNILSTGGTLTQTAAI